MTTLGAAIDVQLHPTRALAGGYTPPPGRGGGYGPPQGGGYGQAPGGYYGQAPGGYYGQPPGLPPQGGMIGQLQVQTSFFFAFWILFFITPRIEINGQVYRNPWGIASFDLPAGQYQLQVFYPYFVLPKAGLATMTVQIQPGHCTMVKYAAPWFIFLWGGTLSLLGVRPAGPPRLMA